MSQSDSESDIWQYQSLRKIKKRGSKDKPANVTVTHGSRSREKISHNKRLNHETSKAEPGCKTGEVQKEASRQDEHEGASPLPPPDTAVTGDGNRFTIVSETEQVLTCREEFCPSCQMPFSILMGQSQRWHISECLDMHEEDRQECPDAFKCSSTIPSHYKKYSHFLLAHSRATNEMASLSPNSSQESVTNASTPSSQSPSPSPGQGVPGQKPTPTHLNAFLLLKSPALGDIRKKKGWSPVAKVQKTVSAEQGGGATRPPAKASGAFRNLREDPVKADFSSTSPSAVPSSPGSPSNSDEISYSPISAPPAGSETPPSRRSLTYSVMAGDKEGERDSVMLYSDDELFAELLTQAEMEGNNHPVNGTVVVNSSETSFTSSVHSSELNEDSTIFTSSVPPGDELNKDSAGVACSPVPVCPLRGLKGQHVAVVCDEHAHADDGRLQLQSPQSLVLDQLRERLCSKVDPGSGDVPSGGVKQEDLVSEPLPSATQSSTHKAPASMAPRKARDKVATSSGLKQTDIGVFFGLKPLKPLKPEGGGALAKENLSQVFPVTGGGAGSWGNGKRKRKATGSTSEPKALGVADGCVTQTQPGGRGGAWRKRWRSRTEEGSELLRQCPFYKKIPGTPFVVDAFQYGAIEGVSAYFLTHFHSDHYGGLKKTFSMPIYCNRITGNLVKSKLRVEPQYIHVLPMNTECTVEGVRVTLLDANHCPGAAMLLLLLPDGQTVLHTGDFRADPSMERYPELLGCRVQTLYLDTTYCSPEYTFPTQQEVITFAVNAAFEHVTLNPRTLVVCGTYSIGKEKVFLAIAEVLGSKVSLSRDKFGIMCCLESERIRQLITTDWNAAQIHILPMMQVNFKNLQAHLNKFSAKYDQVLAFKPTGWTFSNQTEAVEDIQPQVRGNVSIYGVPYSEHSSYLEMKRFVQWLRPLKIIPTVNVGSRDSRQAMERLFSEWRAENTDHLANATGGEPIPSGGAKVTPSMRQSASRSGIALRSPH